MNKQEYVMALRELANFVESKDFPDSWKEYEWAESSYQTPLLVFYVKEKIDFGRLTGLLGSFKKSASESYLRSEKKLDSGATVIIAGSRENVCERIKVGTKIIPAKEAELIPAEPEREEDVYEWKCPDSFVALKEETNDVV